nr:hypothetical protein [Paludisphaera rhizosphaerae]
MADVGLQAVDHQDHPPGLGRDPPEAADIRGGQGQQLVVAVQQVADAPHTDRDAAADQLGVDLGHAAVLGMPQAADRGDDVKSELVLRQGIAALLLGAEAGPMPGAIGVATTADLEPQQHRAVQSDDGPAGGGGRPQRPGAGRAVARVGRRIKSLFGASPPWKRTEWAASIENGRKAEAAQLAFASPGIVETGRAGE